MGNSRRRKSSSRCTQDECHSPHVRRAAMPLDAGFSIAARGNVRAYEDQVMKPVPPLALASGGALR